MKDNLYLKGLFQEDLEHKYNKNQSLPKIKEYLLSILPENYLIAAELVGIPSKFAFDLLAQMCLRKRTTVDVIVGIFHKQFESAQETADMLKLAIEKGLINYDQKRKDVYTKIELPPDIQAELNLFQYPLPMIHEPLKVTNNREMGYRTIFGSIILKDNHHDNDVNLDHINTVNAIPLCLNFETAEFISNSWSDLDKKKDDETDKEFADRQKAFEKYDADSKNVMKIILAMGNEFFNPHNYCKRGRCHTRGYHITNQGTDWNKAVIELANKEIIPLD